MSFITSSLFSLNGLFLFLCTSIKFYFQFSHSVVSDSVTPWTEAHQASLSITNPWSLFTLTSIEPVMHSNHLICCPLLLPPSIFPSIFPVSQLLTSAGQSIGVSASALVLPMNIQDWFPLGLTSWISLQSKGLSSLLQHHSSKASILLCSAFLIVQPSHPCMTTGKSIALTRWTFVGKCLCFIIC